MIISLEQSFFLSFRVDIMFHEYENNLALRASLQNVDQIKVFITIFLGSKSSRIVIWLTREERSYELS